MKCPRDGAELATSTYEAKIEIDTCATCHGTWLDKGELEAIQSTVERDYSKELAVPANTVAESFEAASQRNRAAIHCPKCNAEMDVRPAGMGSQVIIDVCPADCGIWLDAGELQQLEQFFERMQRENAVPAEIPLRWRVWASVAGVFSTTKKKK
jgi:Zn-finger nucleic acid-binding protein